MNNYIGCKVKVGNLIGRIQSKFGSKDKFKVEIDTNQIQSFMEVVLELRRNIFTKRIYQKEELK